MMVTKATNFIQRVNPVGFIWLRLKTVPLKARISKDIQDRIDTKR